MKAYELPVDCPACGSELEHVNASLLAGTETSAIATCPRCHVEYHVIVHLRRIVKPSSERRQRQREAARA